MAPISKKTCEDVSKIASEGTRQTLSGVLSLRSSVVLSVSLHILLFLVCAILILNRPAKITAPRYTMIEVEPALSIKKAQESLKNKTQVVQTEKGATTTTPKADAYLGEHNQTVDRETVSRKHTTVMAQTGTETKSKNTETAKAETKTTKVEKQSTPVPALGNLGLSLFPKYTAKTHEKAEQEAKNDNWADAGSNPQDYVNGYKEADRTALNTKEFRFYGYYQLIRSRLDHAWVPILRGKLMSYYNGGRKLASEMEHRTKVLVVMNSQGEIIRVRVTSESGTSDLDDAAIGAFNEAGPFPNPPKGIITSAGQIEIPWEFILRT